MKTGGKANEVKKENRESERKRGRVNKKEERRKMENMRKIVMGRR